MLEAGGCDRGDSTMINKLRILYTKVLCFSCAQMVSCSSQANLDSAGVILSWPHWDDLCVLVGGNCGRAGVCSSCAPSFSLSLTWQLSPYHFARPFSLVPFVYWVSFGGSEFQEKSVSELEV